MLSSGEVDPLVGLERQKKLTNTNNYRQNFWRTEVHHRTQKLISRAVLQALIAKLEKALTSRPGVAGPATGAAVARPLEADVPR